LKIRLIHIIADSLVEYNIIDGENFIPHPLIWQQYLRVFYGTIKALFFINLCHWITNPCKYFCLTLLMTIRAIGGNESIISSNSSNAKCQPKWGSSNPIYQETHKLFTLGGNICGVIEELILYMINSNCL